MKCMSLAAARFSRFGKFLQQFDIKGLPALSTDYISNNCCRESKLCWLSKIYRYPDNFPKYLMSFSSLSG
jgi:hypothetical protein